MKNKKAQMQGLAGFVMALVVISVVLAVGLIVLTELATTSKEIDPASTRLNESVLSGGEVSQGGLFIGLSACRNTSTSAVYTIGSECNASSGGVISVINASGVYVDYTYYTPNAAYNSTNTVVQKLTQVPTWLGIIVVVSLSMLVLAFFVGKRQ
jgi:hypothetical protein